MTKKERSFILDLISKYEKYSQEELAASALSSSSSSESEHEHYFQSRLNDCAANTLRNLLLDLEGGV